MAPIAEPRAELAPLAKADGSATYSYSGYTVTGSVNGPIEAQRRDENPFEALIDVNVRPAAGVGGTAERQLESILQQALRQLIPIRNFPRTMIQITLQVTETPENAYANTKVVQAQLNLAIIPALLHAAILSLLTAAIPLKTIATAVTLAIPVAEGQQGSSGSIIVDPSTRDADTAKSLHVLGYTSDDELLLAESQGAFTVEEWETVLKTGQEVCCQAAEQGLEDTAMTGSGFESASIRAFVRSVMETKIAADLSWK
ncbi:hypothetical protein PWT90_07326 [Aphanocladium album]|nr:hypothetical protein PWT90_07326 [Aphanocladium album]